MTPRTFCQSGRCEKAKAVVHGVLLVTAGGCAAYNALAWWWRRERHLVVNAAVYTALAGFEWRKVRGHLR